MRAGSKHCKTYIEEAYKKANDRRKRARSVDLDLADRTSSHYDMRNGSKQFMTKYISNAPSNSISNLFPLG